MCFSFHISILISSNWKFYLPLIINSQWNKNNLCDLMHSSKWFKCDKSIKDIEFIVYSMTWYLLINLFFHLIILSRDFANRSLQIEPRIIIKWDKYLAISWKWILDAKLSNSIEILHLQLWKLCFSKYYSLVLETSIFNRGNYFR